MRSIRVLAAAAAICAIHADTATAGVLVDVDLSHQQMTVDVDGKRTYAWSVSSARSGYATPTGVYSPQRLEKMWYSRKYDDAPMPNAIFYSGGYAIHGTGSIGMLGRPASHGCVRLAPGNAAQLYALVQQKGMAATRIVIHGTPPRSPDPAVAQRVPQAVPQVAASTYQGGLLTELFGMGQPTYVTPRNVYGERSSHGGQSRFTRR